MNPFQAVVDKLELKTALTRGSERNDLLLPRAEDKVSGEVGKRFLDALTRDLERGRYDPVPAYTVSVPKSPFATRPASLLTLNDRVVYEAVVATLRPRVESSLLGAAIVYWPRGVTAPKRWLDFENAALNLDPAYIVVADVSGFYESIDHDRLGDVLIRATGRRAEVEALLAFLERVMRGRRGLPQGLEPSDALATAYLSDVDHSMVRAGYDYARHGDDIRVAVKSFDQAREAISHLERAVRLSGLLLNAQKTKILRCATYSRELKSIEDTIAETKAKVFQKKVSELSDDRDRLLEVVTDSDVELAWAFFYHESISYEDLIEELRPRLEASEVELAESLFIDTWNARPDIGGELSGEAFHQRLVTSLLRMAAGRSRVALETAGEILTTYPDKTEVVCSYLLALASDEPEVVAEQAGEVLANGRFRTEWEAAWALRVLTEVANDVSDDIGVEIRAIVTSPWGGWLAAVEGAKLWGARGTLQQQTLRRLWDSCPPVFHADLITAARFMAPKVTWAETFLSAVANDRINAVVAARPQPGS